MAFSRLKTALNFSQLSVIVEGCNKSHHSFRQSSLCRNWFENSSSRNSKGKIFKKVLEKPNQSYSNRLRLTISTIYFLYSYSKVNCMLVLYWRSVGTASKGVICSGTLRLEAQGAVRKNCAYLGNSVFGPFFHRFQPKFRIFSYFSLIFLWGLNFSIRSIFFSKERHFSRNQSTFFMQIQHITH